MRDGYSITALARASGVSSKTLRYWERLGLLPRAARSHTGYRVFAPEAVQYVQFVQKAKSIGLTLKECRHVLELASHGRNPCPEVVGWVERKLAQLEEQIGLLRGMQRRLRRVQRDWSQASECFGEGELCCLIQGLPLDRLTKGESTHAQAVRSSVNDRYRAGH